MRILIYEYLTGGGLWSESVDDPGHHPLLAEGACMVHALSEDLAGVPGVEIVQFQDARLVDRWKPLGEVIQIHDRTGELKQLASCSSRVDGTILIAPEMDGRLLERCEVVQQQGGKLFSPASDFVKLATDKQATAQHLSAAGIATPHAMPVGGKAAELAVATESARGSSTLHNDASLSPSPRSLGCGGWTTLLPVAFPYPAVLKPNDGVGSLDTFLIQNVNDWPQSAATDRVWRLEQYCHGTPVSVAALCGPRGIALLPPCRQHISADGRFQYLGGEYPVERPLVRRACQLARRVLAALPDTVGYVGIDMILDETLTPRSDVVVDVNPRLTTSYIGLRRAASSNLADALLAVARGSRRSLFFHAGRVRFDAKGHVTSDVGAQ